MDMGVIMVVSLLGIYLTKGDIIGQIGFYSLWGLSAIFVSINNIKEIMGKSYWKRAYNNTYMNV